MVGAAALYEHDGGLTGKQGWNGEVMCYDYRCLTKWGYLLCTPPHNDLMQQL